MPGGHGVQQRAGGKAKLGSSFRVETPDTPIDGLWGMR